MCELAGVSRASFYRDWEQKAPSEAEVALRDAVQRTALAHRDHGYRRITPLLQRAGFVVGEEKVRRILRSDNLLAVRRRKFVVTTDSNHRFRVHPNLAESMELTVPNQLWVADITYIRLRREFVFLAVVLDAFSRKAIGWELGRTLDVCSGQDLNKRDKFWEMATQYRWRGQRVMPVRYDRRPGPSSAAPNSERMLPATWTESLKIGISPVVRISPIGVMRIYLGRRSTVLVFPSYSGLVLRVLCASAAWREID